MSTLVKGTISSSTFNTPYDSVWASIYDTDMQVPQIWPELVKYYGEGVGLLEWLYAANAIVPVAGPSKTLFEEGSLTKLVTIGAAAIATQLAGVNITFSLAAAEFIAPDGTVLTDSCYLSLNDIVVIPAEYVTDGGVACTKPELYQVTAVSAANGVLKVFTATPLKVTVALAVAVPAGSALMVTGGNYPNGVQSGSPKSAGWYHRTFVTSTKKADWGMTGSIQSNERYYEKLRGGGNGVFTKATIEADFLLSKAINDEIILGGGITNTLTMLDRSGNAIQATGTVGILQHMVTAAMKQYYTLAYSAPDFDDIKDLLNSQGVTNRNVAFFVGSLLQKQIENAGLEFLKEFSGGTDLMRTLNSWGVDFRFIHKNGIQFMLKEIPSFSDPTAYGADVFEDYFTGLGFIIPDVDVTVKGSLDDAASFKLKNFSLGYKSANGENRTRVNKILQGAASIGSASSEFARDTYDDAYGTMLSEFMVIFLRRNQTILVQNDVVL
jgi:hypothetical protein